MYCYLVNELGERRSPVSTSKIVSHWLRDCELQYASEILSIEIDDENTTPGYWVDDSGHYN